MKSLTVRCSRLPLIALCPGAAAKPEIEINSDSEAARLGSAFHHLFTERVAGRYADFDAACARWRIEDKDELRKLCAWGWSTWNSRFREHFPEPMVEHSLEGRFYSEDDEIELTITGTMDVVSVSGDEARILDPKSGRLDLDHSEQLNGYRFLARCNFGVSRVYAATMLVRKWESDGSWSSREEVDAWINALARKLSGPETFNPGEHCGYCPRRNECDAYAGWLRLNVGAFDAVALSIEQSRSLEPRQRGQWLINALGVIKAVEKACERAREAVHAEVASAGGCLPTGEGREIYLATTRRRKVEPWPAWGLLSEQFGEERLIDCCVSLGIGKLEDLAGQDAGRGQKGAAKKDLIDRLDQLGAITRTTSERLETRRVPLQIAE
jgi:hypothetical protein